ncbi:MAG: hypothetical protein AAF250_10785 [Pseudomonadota bacterium]
MGYTFEEVCRPNFEYFEYDRAEQLEFEFFRQELVRTFRIDVDHLKESVRSEETRTLASFQDHARYMTSCFYTKLLKEYVVVSCPVYSTEMQFSILRNFYARIRCSKLLVSSHIEGLESYFTALRPFCETTNA